MWLDKVNYSEAKDEQQTYYIYRIYMGQDEMNN